MVNIRSWYGSPPFWQENTYHDLLCVQNYFITTYILILYLTQAYRVAWRNILDWVQAQMALLEIGMAKIEEVFLPYMQDREGVTFFERMEQRGFLLDSGKRQEEAA